MGFFRRLLRRQGAATTPSHLPNGEASGASPGNFWELPRFAVVDVETTGLRADEHRVVEIAVVTTDARGRMLEEWSTRVNPQGPIGATHIHGLTQDDVADAPVFAEVLPELNRRLSKSAVAAHNARFDLAFLRHEYRRAGWNLPFVPALCTLEASAYHLPTLDRRRLADCCWAVGARVDGAHSALGDARATASLLAAFMHPTTGYPPLPEHTRMLEQAFSIEWPTRAGLSLGPAVESGPRQSRALSPRARHVIAVQSTATPAASLLALIGRFSLVDALDEGAPEGALAYLEKLAEVLEDGEITGEEAADLAAVTTSMSLSPAEVAVANQAFVLALANEALADGRVSRAEREELTTVANLLGVSPKVIPTLLDRAEDARHARLSEGLKPLPETWQHGAPVRVGDKVVFTGCDEAVRTRLEEQSERLGVRVLGSVSAKVALLVTDGSMNGGKARRAAELGTRVVHPDVYAVMLTYLQPPLSRTWGSARPCSPRQPDEALAAAEGSIGAPVVAPSVGGPGPAAPNPAHVRSWARANGLEVGVRGRLSKDVVQAFVDAQAAASSAPV